MLKAVGSSYRVRISEYISELQQIDAMILKRHHQIAFIGSIGVGKSTAICRLTGLEIPTKKGDLPAPVLEAGAGGITVCEVHLRTGPSYGLIIQPCSDTEIREHVADFAEHICKINQVANGGSEEASEDSQGISKEIERAIRNMAGLKIRREKGTDGKTTKRDEATELYQKAPTVRELTVEILACMELYKRDRIDIWYDSSSGKPPLVWQKDIFEEVNNGRHPEFTLPQRIEVVVPNVLMGNAEFSFRIIDTKGIDRNTPRADLESHLDEPHTLAVLCSRFNDAPATDARLLLERAKQAGVRSLANKVVLLVLPHPDEALAVKDEAGIRVDTMQEGYELKGEQVCLSLEPLVRDMTVYFFNAKEDDPEAFRTFLKQLVSNVRSTFQARLDEVTTNAQKLLSNQQEEQVQEVIRHAGAMLKAWADDHLDALDGQVAQIEDSLIEQFTRAYAGTVRATVRREGD